MTLSRISILSSIETVDHSGDLACGMYLVVGMVSF